MWSLVDQSIKSYHNLGILMPRLLWCPLTGDPEPTARLVFHECKNVPPLLTELYWLPESVARRTFKSLMLSYRVFAPLPSSWTPLITVLLEGTSPGTAIPPHKASPVQAAFAGRPSMAGWAAEGYKSRGARLYFQESLQDAPLINSLPLRTH